MLWAGSGIGWDAGKWTPDQQYGYTNICYFNLINEPCPKELAPGIKFDFEQWKSASDCRTQGRHSLGGKVHGIHEHRHDLGPPR